MRGLSLLITGMLLVVSLVAVGECAVIVVDVYGGGDWLTIGDAILAASDGDTISILPGTYSGAQNRGLTFDGMNLVIASTGGASVTTIDCEGADRAFLLSAGHDTSTVFDGIRITNGDARALRGTSGGAIRLEPGASAKIVGCGFDGNSAEIGGALSISNGGAAVVRSCTFSGNTATLYGGAVDCDQDDSVLRGCDFDNNTAERGGGLRISYSSMDVVDCDFTTANTASDRGGSIYHTECEGSEIRGCTFTGSQAYDGGAVCCSMSEVFVSGCTFTANEATIEGGGLLCRTYEPNVMVTGCVFTGNTAAHGAGLNLLGNSMTVDGCEFDSNAASNTAGGVYAYVETLSVTDCHFTGNYISETGGSGDGGAFRFYGAVDLLIDECTFTDGNSAVSEGGAAYIMNCVGDVSDCLFDGNTAPTGAGLYARGSELTVTGCVFSNNSASSNGGGMAWAYSAVPTITHCTLFRNEAPAGGGVHLDASPGTITECSFACNSATTGGGIYALVDGGTVERSILAHGRGGGPLVVSGLGPETSHCYVFGNAGGDSLQGEHHDNEFADPLFCSVPGDDYQLCANSPCLAAASPWGELIGAHGQGCGACESAVCPMSWGSIKALYR